MLQLAVLPNSSISSSSTSTPWRDPSTSRRGSYRILGLRWVACRATVWGRGVEEGETRTRQTWFKRWYCSMGDPTKRNVGFSPFPFFHQKNRNFPLHFHSYSKAAPLQHSIKYKGKLTRMRMHLNDSQIIANIYFTTKDKSCESVYKRKTTNGVTTT